MEIEQIWQTGVLVQRANGIGDGRRIVEPRDFRVWPGLVTRGSEHEGLIFSGPQNFLRQGDRSSLLLLELLLRGQKHDAKIERESGGIEHLRRLNGLIAVRHSYLVLSQFAKRIPMSVGRTD